LGDTLSSYAHHIACRSSFYPLWAWTIFGRTTHPLARGVGASASLVAIPSRGMIDG